MQAVASEENGAPANPVTERCYCEGAASLPGIYCIESRGRMIAYARLGADPQVRKTVGERTNLSHVSQCPLIGTKTTAGETVSASDPIGDVSNRALRRGLSAGS